MSGIVRLGFLGGGYMGQIAHLPNFVNSEKCQVAALAEKRIQLGKKVSEKFNILRLYGSVEELAQDKQIDAVAAITSPQFHLPIAECIMEAGKHLFIEKPTAFNVKDAERMVEYWHGSIK